MYNSKQNITYPHSIRLGDTFSRGKNFQKTKVALDEPPGLLGKMTTFRRMKQILGLELLARGLVLPEPLLLVRCPLATLVDGLLQGMAPYLGALQEDGQIM